MIGENLAKPAAKVMAYIYVQNQLMTHLCQTQFFTLQLGKQICCLLQGTFMLAVYEFLFCRSLLTNTTGEAIFDSLNDFIVQNNLDWTRCVGICTDGATAMTGKQKGLAARVQGVASCATVTHCCAHREQLAVKKNATMPQISTG